MLLKKLTGSKTIDSVTEINIMKRLVSVTLTVFFVSQIANAVQAQSIFEDKNLEAVVRKYVFAKRNNEEPLTEQDVENISTIEGKAKGVTSLKGMEKCRSLALLDLEGNEITDLAPIAGLKNIQSLNVANNKITDAGPVAELVGLQYLQLSGNELTDLTPLKGLANLRSLYLSNNQLTDLTPIAELGKVWSLYVDGNKLTDLKPITKLTKITSLDLRGNEVTDLSPIAGYTELRYLLINNNKIADLNVLVEMAKKDSEGQKRFAPFWRIYTDGNPLSDGAKGQLDALKGLGARINPK